MEEVVGGVQREHVQCGVHQEEADDAEEEVDRSDGRVDRLRRRRGRQAGDEERSADLQVGDVVQRIDLEDPEEQAALGREELDAAGDDEAQQSDDDVDRAEERGEQSIR